MKEIELRPNADRAKNAIVLLYLVLIMDIISLISGYMQYSLLGRIATGNFTMVEAEMNDLREMLVAVIYFGVFITSAVFFIRWFRRAFFNLHQLSRRLQYSEGWAAGAWFVPILNWFRPFQIMSEMVTETRSILVSRNLIEKSKLASGVVGLWWTLWIVNSLFANFEIRYSLRAETMDQYLNSSLFGMINSVLGIFAAFVAIRMVKMYSAVEEILATVPDIDAQQDEVSTEIETSSNTEL